MQRRSEGIPAAVPLRTPAVAILALDFIVPGVDLVAECNRLPRPGVGDGCSHSSPAVDGESEERGKERSEQPNGAAGVIMAVSF